MTVEEVQHQAVQQPKTQPLLAAAPAPVSIPTVSADSTTMPPPSAILGGSGGSSSEDSGVGSNEEANASGTTGDKPTKKRSASVEDNGGPDSKSAKVTKRRAARACVSCRQRKVRCDVVEGAPCGNCRWDNVECVVQESRRRKKNLFPPPSAGLPHVGSANAEALRAKLPAAPINVGFAGLRRASDGSLLPMSTPTTTGGDSSSNGLLGAAGGTSHFNAAFFQRAIAAADPDLLARLQQIQQNSQSNPPSNPSSSPYLWSSSSPLNQGASLFPHLSRTQHFLNTLEQPDPLSHLPAFIKPLPTKTLPEDVKYLHTKGALTLPTLALQNACLRCFVEFVHPYMPIMDVHEFLAIINDREGAHGQVSLLLYQAVMFSACAFVEMKHLRDAGFSTRKEARRAFFYKTRHLYDLDYESDRLVLVQSLLLMSYWYETPDDQKDTWHWMGVAISLAHTIGLHRNPTATNMPMRRQKLWTRIWWSCFMRDRMVALGMRRPTRIKDEDFDVPMLGEDDFDIEPLSDDITLVTPDCTILRDVGKQLELAQLCIAKAKLCLLIGRMLKTQYSVLIRDRNRMEDTTHSTMMLLPNKKLENLESVASCDLDLRKWLNELPPTCEHRPLSPLDIKNGNATIAVQRNLLHMVYYTTISALHRPQFLPSSPHQMPTASHQVQETSRMNARDSAMQITRMVHELSMYRIDKYLQTSGVTVILPAMIIHLLDMKNPYENARDKACRGFRQCMRSMLKLREMYSAADYAIGFLDAALQKANISLDTIGRKDSAARAAARSATTPGRTDELNTPPPDNAPYLNSTEMNLFHQNRSYLPKAPKQNSKKPNPLTAATDPTHPANPATANKDMDSAVGLSPDATASSGSSDHGGSFADISLGPEVNLGVANGSWGEDFDWNAVPAGHIDFDQLLHFPTEGGGYSGTDDMSITGIVGLMQAQAAADDARMQAQAAEAAEAALQAAADDMISWPDETEQHQHQHASAAGPMDVDSQILAHLAGATA